MRSYPTSLGRFSDDEYDPTDTDDCSESDPPGHLELPNYTSNGKVICTCHACVQCGGDPLMCWQRCSDEFPGLCCFCSYLYFQDISGRACGLLALSPFNGYVDV